MYKRILAITMSLLLIVGCSSNSTKSKTKTASKEKTFSSLDYYKKDNLKRYQDYQKANPKLSLEDVVTRVNMNIDTPFYSNIIQQTKPNSLDTIVNKVYQLDLNYIPSDLVNINDGYSNSSDPSYGYRNHQVRKVVYDDFKKLYKACKDKGINLYVVSGYRSTQWQTTIYNHNSEVYGKEETDKTVSRPGHSEHTTGLGMDIALDNLKYQEVEKHQNYKWFVSVLADYGFIIRYPNGQENLTGYTYECWHIRYLGSKLAKKVAASGLTYDEYYARHH